eukprot:1335161-Pleurochrysis_carterae.AAC.1
MSMSSNERGCGATNATWGAALVEGTGRGRLMRERHSVVRGLRWPRQQAARHITHEGLLSVMERDHRLYTSAARDSPSRAANVRESTAQAAERRAGGGIGKEETW